MPLADIETFVFLMLENRSFDHAAGYLSSQAAKPPLPVDGIRDDPVWIESQTNYHGSTAYKLHPLTAGVQIIPDPPHDSATISTQITTPAGQSGHAMGGFVDSYMTSDPPPPDPSLVMGWYGPDAVPMFDFFAHNYTVCDHWFSSLPTGTQANRLMAMSGESRLLDNAPALLPEQDLAYDWLDRHTIDWCVYQWGEFLPFFALMPKWLPRIVRSLAFEPHGPFRRYSRLREQWLSSDPMPKVIFVEPEYTDGPHLKPNDDHPPTGIARGQALLADLYNTLTANPLRWQNTMLIVTYDEHGGFFDHVPPLAMPDHAGGTAIGTTGVRVPAFLVSPHVRPGEPFTANVDHTSFLQLLADRFDSGRPYSASVAARQSRLSSFTAALGPAPDAPVANLQPPGVMASVRKLATARSAVRPRRSGNETGDAFHQAAMKFASEQPHVLATPAWSRLAQYVSAPRTMPDPARRDKRRAKR